MKKQTVKRNAELREKSAADLQVELAEVQKAHFGLRMQKATNNLQNKASLIQARREVARVKTILTEKQKGAAK